jgi:hypothetical protein
LEITLAGSDEKIEASEATASQIPEGTNFPVIPKKAKSRLNISEELILGNKDEPIRTRSTFKTPEETPLGLVSLIEPTSCDEALQDDDWVLVMQEELDQFSKNDVWDLVPKPKGTHIIGTRWLFRNKLNEKGEVVRNKARPMAQGYSQQEGIY